MKCRVYPTVKKFVLSLFSPWLAYLFFRLCIKHLGTELDQQPWVIRSRKFSITFEWLKRRWNYSTGITQLNSISTCRVLTTILLLKEWKCAVSFSSTVQESGLTLIRLPSLSPSTVFSSAKLSRVTPSSCNKAVEINFCHPPYIFFGKVPIQHPMYM